MTSSLLGVDTTTGKQVAITQASRRQHLAIFGKSGTGKSGLIQNLILHNAYHNMGFGVIDPHGDLIDGVLSRFPKERQKDLLLLDIAQTEKVAGLTLLECSGQADVITRQQVSDQVLHIFEKVYGISRDNPHMFEYLLNATDTLLSNPGSSIIDIELLFTDEAFRRSRTATLTDPSLKRFWATYDSLKPSQQYEQYSSITNKLVEMVKPLVKNILGQSKSTLNLREIMDSGKILLVRLDRRLPIVTSLIGSILIALITQAAFSRIDTPPENRRQWNLYCDEFHRFATQDFADLIDEARKFGITCTLSTQTLSQIDARTRASLKSCGNMAFFAVNGEDADHLVKELDVTPPQPAIIDRKPLMAITQDPVHYLLRWAHTNHVVNAFTQQYLLPANAFLSSGSRKKIIIASVEEGWRSWAGFALDYYLCSAEVSEAFSCLNSLFYHVMTTKNLNVHLAPELLVICSKFCGFAYLFVPYFYCLENNLDYTGKPSPFPNLAREQMAKRRGKFEVLLLPNFEDYLGIAWNNLVVYPRDKVYINKLPDDFERCKHFLRHLRLILQALAEDPIWVNTGQFQPVFDKPRTYSDVADELANKMRTLNNYRAIVRLITSEGVVFHTIKTIAPQPMLDAKSLRQVKEAIWEQNVRDGYLRAREEVEAEIAERQRRPPQPPITRKHTL